MMASILFISELQYCCMASSSHFLFSYDISLNSDWAVPSEWVRVNFRRPYQSGSIIVVYQLLNKSTIYNRTNFLEYSRTFSLIDWRNCKIMNGIKETGSFFGAYCDYDVLCPLNPLLGCSRRSLLILTCTSGFWLLIEGWISRQTPGRPGVNFLQQLRCF